MYGSGSIADFAIYQEPYKLYLECKTTITGTFPRANLSDKQYTGMLKENLKRGVSCGIIIWWQKFDETTYIPISEVEKIFSKVENKSIKYSDLENITHWKVPAKKKKVMFSYDLTELVYKSNKLKET